MAQVLAAGLRSPAQPPQTVIKPRAGRLIPLLGGECRWEARRNSERRRRKRRKGSVGGAMGGEGAVKLSTQFTQTALSARVEAGRRR